MPLVAKDKTTGRRLDITRFKQPRLELNAADVVCQLCDVPMIIRAGAIIRPHFAHKTDCTSDYSAHPESPEHLRGKTVIAEKVHKEWFEYGRARVEFEWPVPEVRRIIDVAMLFPNGWIVAHEIQLASITPLVLLQRTEDYRNAGIDVIWWLGKNADTPANRTWCLNYLGSCFLIDYTQLTSS